MPSNTVRGFKVIPLQFSQSSTSCHNVFVKEHSVREADDNKPSGRTLFVLNVPPYATQGSLKFAFSKAGRVKSVIFQHDDEKHANDGFRRAYIVFEKREGLLRFMKLDTINPLSDDSKPLKVGLEKWIENYNSSIYDPEELQKKINTYMVKYDKTEGKKKKADKEELVDDEGWTVVTKKGRNPGVSRKKSAQDALKKKSKKKHLKNFYTFQIRESKMEQIAVLRKSFEEAKSKINMMKQARKFKPY